MTRCKAFKRGVVATILSTLFLSGCTDKISIESISNYTSGQEEDAVVYLGADIELLVKPEKVAKVHGFDDCPSTPLFVKSQYNGTGCIKLEGDSVNVILRDGEKLWTEAWDLNVSDGKYTLTTPTGFVVSEPIYKKVDL